MKQTRSNANSSHNLTSVTINPFRIVRSFWSYRELIIQMTAREISMRHRGTYLGVLWSFITPLLMLSIYTFVFSVVLQSKWVDPAHPTKGIAQFAMTLLAGIIPFNVFSETVNRSPTLILSVPNYVKKVIFPLEILPIVSLCSALVHSLISISILMLSISLLLGFSSWTAIYLPFAYLPLILLCLGLSWILSSLGVYMRDIKQTVEIIVQMLFFLTPIFYSVITVPESFRILLYMNPLTAILSDFRRSLLWQESLDWRLWGIWTGITLLLSFVGYVWFMKTKSGFANVM